MKNVKGKRKGFLVCVEGLDGCGKTTQTRLLVERLTKNGYAAEYTAEPSSGKIGLFIREYCLHCEKRGSSVIEALLFAADRSDHVESCIRPALKKGKTVVSDRYIYSSLAYQGATGLDSRWIKEVNKHAIHPDFAVFIDVEPEIVVQRLKRERSVMETLETQQNVREIYMRFVKKRELVRVDGNRSRQEVADDILMVVSEFLTSATKKS